MANNALWYKTLMPKKLIDIVREDIDDATKDLKGAKVFSGVQHSIRDSRVDWLPSYHWIVGLCYHYVLRANRDNFLYDISGFDQESMQYTSYNEGEYYNWHVDAGLNCFRNPGENKQENFVFEKSEEVRKLSVIVQLSDPDEYEGGEVQLMSDNDSSFFLPKTRGTVIVFDSRTKHRVKKVISGHRQSLVGWVVGPRWK